MNYRSLTGNDNDNQLWLEISVAQLVLVAEGLLYIHVAGQICAVHQNNK